MRRPRRKLEVNTFPFLAVLLCAMGSFILLLMVIDRRAKIVSQNKAYEAHLARKLAYEAEHESALTANKERNDKLRFAWQAQKDKIHAELQAEEDALAREITQILAALAKTDDQLVGEKTKANSLAQKVNMEDAVLKALQKELQSRQDQFERAKQASQGHLKLREQLTRDLVLLEAALRNVQERKSRERPVYSLVPYKGKHGASSRPTYIEVADGTVAIHPGPTTLTPATWSATNLLRAIEERTGPLEREVIRKGLPPLESEKNPYLLFLVRPSGISTYYESLQALRGYRVDFGYELVEADWEFDFSGDKMDQQPWRNVAKLDVEPSNVTRPAPKGMGPRVLGNGGGNDAGFVPGGTASGFPGNENASPGAASFRSGQLGTGDTRGNGQPGRVSLGTPGAAYGQPGSSANGSATGGAGGGQIGSFPGVAPGAVAIGSGGGTIGGNFQGNLGQSGVPNGTPPFPAAGGIASFPGNKSGITGGNAAGGTGDGPYGQNPGMTQRPTGNGEGNGGGLGNGPSLGSPASTLGVPLGQFPSGVAGTGSPYQRGPGTNGGRGALGGANATGGFAGGQSTGQSNLGGGGPGGPSGNGPGGDSSQASPGQPNVTGNNPAGGQVGQGGGGSQNPGSPNGGGGGLPTNVTINLNGQTSDQPPTPPSHGSPPPSDNPLTFRNAPAAIASDNPGNSNGNSSGEQFPTGGGRPRAPGDPDEGEPGPRVGNSPFLPAEKSRPGPRLPALGRIIGNRDFVMTVECYDNKVTLSPPGKTFDFSSPEALEHLATSMKTLVARRQGTVRPGEPPYRPLVHFRVQPDGRRTYYAVYPRLAEFGFPMSRESPD